MKKILIYIFFASAFFGCAKQVDLPNDKLFDFTLEKWLLKNDPSALPIGNTNVYIRYVERGPEQDTMYPVYNSPYCWLDINYSGYTMNGVSFVTRNTHVKHIAGGWNYLTHWCNDFTTFNQDNPKMPSGMGIAIAAMRPGDSARIYLPYNMSYSVAFGATSGYLGETTNYTSMPVYFDIRLKDVTYDASRYEIDSVNRYASKRWHQTINDTIAPGIYFRRLNVEDKTKDTITKDSTVAFYYVETFTDGFMIITNSDSVARSYPGRYQEANPSMGLTYKPYVMRPFFSPTAPAAVSHALVNMRKGDSAEVVCISYYAEGDGFGNQMEKPEILPYQPLMFKVYVLDSILGNSELQ